MKNELDYQDPVIERLRVKLEHANIEIERQDK